MNTDRPTRPTFVCEIGHIFRSKAKFAPGFQRVCPECLVVVPDSAAQKSIGKARRASELAISNLTASRLKRSALANVEYVFTRGRLVKKKVPSRFLFSDSELA